MCVTCHLLQMIGTVVVYILVMVDCNAFGGETQSAFNSSAVSANMTLQLL